MNYHPQRQSFLGYALDAYTKAVNKYRQAWVRGYIDRAYYMEKKAGLFAAFMRREQQIVDSFRIPQYRIDYLLPTGHLPPGFYTVAIDEIHTSKNGVDVRLRITSDAV